MEPKAMDPKQPGEKDVSREAKPELEPRDAELDEMRKPIERRERESEEREHGELTEE